MKRFFACFLAVLIAISVFFIGALSAAADSYLIGDADGDGNVTIFDATKIQRVIADMDPDEDGAIIRRGDVDQDEELTIFDVTYIQRYLADLSVEYPVNIRVEDPAPTEEPTEAPTVQPTSARDRYELPPV